MRIRYTGKPSSPRTISLPILGTLAVLLEADWKSSYAS